MINNRQNGRRGRGRGNGGMRPMNGGGGGQDRGNRIDNRARGNANQLHEKYKTLARDAQTAGDRVMTEYYLQFADHYFRVLSESRSRFEDQQQQRRAQGGWQDEYDGEDGMDGDGQSEPQGEQRPAEREGGRYADREERPRDRERPRREDREPRYERRDAAGGQERSDDSGDADSEQQAPMREVAPRADVAEPKPRRGRPRREPVEAAPAALDADRLPAFLVAPSETSAPAAAEANGVEEQVEAPRRRRTRRPRTDDAGVVAEA